MITTDNDNFKNNCVLFLISERLYLFYYVQYKKENIFKQDIVLAALFILLACFYTIPVAFVTTPIGFVLIPVAFVSIPIAFVLIPIAFI